MPKKYNDKIKSQAKHMYIMSGKSLADISAALGPHITTLKNWCEEDGWDNLRNIKYGSRVAVEISALNQIQLIFANSESESRILNASETDQLAKLQKLIETTNSDLAFVSNAIEAIGEFSDFVRKERPELFEEIAPLIMDFSHALSKKYTKGGA